MSGLDFELCLSGLIEEATVFESQPDDSPEVRKFKEQNKERFCSKIWSAFSTLTYARDYCTAISVTTNFRTLNRESLNMFFRVAHKVNLLPMVGILWDLDGIKRLNTFFSEIQADMLIGYFLDCVHREFPEMPIFSVRSGDEHLGLLPINPELGLEGTLADVEQRIKKIKRRLFHPANYVFLHPLPPEQVILPPNQLKARLRKDEARQELVPVKISATFYAGLCCKKDGESPEETLEKFVHSGQRNITAQKLARDLQQERRERALAAAKAA